MEINNAHGNVQLTHNKNKPGCLFRQSQIQHFKIAKLVWKYPWVSNPTISFCPWMGANHSLLALGNNQ